MSRSGASGSDELFVAPAAGMGARRQAHLSLRIGRVARLLRQRQEARVRDMGLTPAQMHAVAVVRYNEGCSQRGIAEILEVGEVTGGRLLSRLEALGWIERRPDRDDGRVMRVYLGQEATVALRALDEIALAEEREALAGLTVADVDHMLRCLDAVSSNFGRPIDRSMTGGVKG